MKKDILSKEEFRFCYNYANGNTIQDINTVEDKVKWETLKPLYNKIIQDKQMSKYIKSSW